MTSKAWIWLREIAAAVIIGTVAMAAGVIALHISPSDLTMRWATGSDDQILHYMTANGATHGSLYAADPLLGFPNAQDLFFAPIYDFASAMEMAVLALFVHNGILLLNLFYVFGFFATAVCGYAALRLLGVRIPMAMTFAAVFALAPYHFERVAMGHAFVANYGGVAFVAVGMAVVTDVDTPLRRWIEHASSQRSRLIRRVLTVVIVAVPIAASFNYYYVFAMIVLIGMLAFSVLSSLISRQGMRRMAWPAITVGGVIALCGTELLILAQNFGERYATYFSVRGLTDSETYGGKISTLLLPWQGSAIPLLGKLARKYLSESGLLVASEPPGTPIIAAVAMIAMALLLILRVMTPRLPTWLSDPRLGTLAAGFLWSLFFFVAGGLSAIFALTISGDIRAWSRLSIIMIFLGLAFAAILLDRLLSGRLASAVAIVIIAVIVVVDQLWGVARATPLRPTDDRSLKTFVTQLDKITPDGCGVVELPLMSFPESGPIYGVTDYLPALPFLYSGDHLKWSYGAVRGTYAGDYWDGVTTPSQFARKYADADACGIMVDTSGYMGSDWQKYVDAVPGAALTLRSSGDDGRYLYYSTR